MYDYLIVGSGLYGSVFANEAKKRGFKCIVVEKRKTIGGNCYCENIDGINVHKYGAHVFHTNSEYIWNYVNQFVEFNNYINSPIAYCGDDKIVYNLPFNMNTFNKIWPDVITPLDALNKIKEDTPYIDNPKNLEECAISMVGKTLYEKLIKGYTEKQWGRKCDELSGEIIKRIPLRFSYNNNYFNDKYQGIPIGGYNIIFNSLLENIDVVTNEDYFKKREYWNKKANKILFTGMIDEFYNYKYGRLDYRSAEWKIKKYNLCSYQGNAVVNRTTTEVGYTRSIEHKYFECLSDDKINEIPFTIVSEEYPKEYNGKNEPFYPINNKLNNNIYEKYKSISLRETNVIFGGRLAEYKYYDMSPTIESALNFWKG